MCTYVYLDHNVLDLMTKGDPNNVKEFISSESLSPLYSSENLNEIQRSKGYELNFLDLLNDINASYMSLKVDSELCPVGGFEILAGCALERYADFVSSNSSEFHGLDLLLRKSYGGANDVALPELFQKMNNELSEIFADQLFENDVDPFLNERQKKELEDTLELMPNLMSSANESFTGLGDTLTVREFEKMTMLGPKVLKNINPPNVLEQIYEMHRVVEGFEETDFETFYGLVVSPKSGVTPTTEQKVNAIYHQLNFVGYYRDSKMQKERRFKASMSDMSHSANASFCDYFLCGDEDMVKKAEAAYAYLDLDTEVVSYQS